jgi:hypothetical protein
MAYKPLDAAEQQSGPRAHCTGSGQRRDDLLCLSPDGRASTSAAGRLVPSQSISAIEGARIANA